MINYRAQVVKEMTEKEAQLEKMHEALEQHREQLEHEMLARLQAEKEKRLCFCVIRSHILSPLIVCLVRW